jgi:hypothetical protein
MSKKVLSRMKKQLLPTLMAMSTLACNDKPLVPGSFGYDLSFLTKHDPDLALLQYGDSKLILSPKYQAKVFTSTTDGEESFGWIHYKAFDGPLDPHMNAYGGENRLWLGPEGGKFSLFFPNGAKMEFANWKTPAAFDSEPWTLYKKTDSSAVCSKAMQLSNFAGTQFSLEIKRTIIIMNPGSIEHWLGVNLNPAVKAVGYRTENTLTNTGTQAWDDSTGMPCLWVLDMFAPSDHTTIVIPYKKDTTAKAATTDYFGEIPADRLRDGDGVYFFKADGKQRGKLGIHPSSTKDVAGSYDAEKKVLTIILFDRDPLARYLNQQWRTDLPPFNGDAMNAYNDGPLADGSQMGPFYELESVSPATFLPPGHSATHRHSVFHFTASEEQLDAISTKVLGVSLARVKSIFP